MLFSSGSTFRKRTGEKVLLLLALGCLCFNGILMAQVDPEAINRAFDILDRRGELVFEFFTGDIRTVKKINSFLSVDRQTPEGYEAYADKKGFRAFLELGIPFRLIERQGTKKSQADSTGFPGNWDVYPTHDQYLTCMQEMALAHPDICRLDTIGYSVQGREILVMKISDRPGEREPEPAFVYSSTMHGDEPTGYAILLRLIHHICTGYGTDTIITRLVDRMEIWINPLANPDGACFMENGVLVPKRFNANNVDLNRDFPGLLDGEPGDLSLVQPENRAQINFLRRIYMVMGANIHSGTEVINYPFDAWKDLHADNDWYIRTSGEYAALAQERSYPVLYMSGFDSGITNGWEWFEVQGSRQDWVNYYNHAREVTIEISRAKTPPPSELPYFWHYNHPSMLRYMEHCLYGIQGQVRDAGTGKPLGASIRVLDHDTLRSMAYADSMNGYFARPIEPGTWDLEISFPGYHTMFINGVHVEADRASRLDLSLEPLSTGIRQTGRMEVAPNPFCSRIELSIPVIIPGTHSVFVYDMNGRLLIRQNRFFDSAGNNVWTIEAGHLPYGFYILRLVSPYQSFSLKIFKSEWK